MQEFQYPSDNNPEARAAEFRAMVSQQFRTGGERMTKLEAATEHNSVAIEAATKQIQAQTEATAEMIELFQAMKGGMKVLGWIGLFAKWAAAIAAGVGLIMKLTGWSWPGK
jgi:hypothetical protein